MGVCCNDKIHIAIIGSGSGAFAAAIKAVENGATVTLIEAAEVIGGTCVNIGCVPSKIMIKAAHIVHLQNHHGFDGVMKKQPVIDRKKMLAQQQGWVKKLRYEKYEKILQNNPQIEFIRGKAEFKNSHTLIVSNKNGEKVQVHADKILIAVGARALIPDITGLSNTPYWTSTQALVTEVIPQQLTVLGGSVVALELAQAFSHLGANVTIIARSTLLSREDKEIGEALKTVLEEEGIRVILHTVPDDISFDENQFTLQTSNEKIICDQLLVATGRQSNADTLVLQNVGVNVNASGAIMIDDHMQTTVKSIYAVGDCTSQPQFVYVAAAAGTRAARNMTGDDVTLDLSVVPQVVFTTPQIASVGLTEQQAKAENINVNSRTLALEHVPRALANMDTRGFIKLVAEIDSGRIVGCQIVASEAGEMIQTAALAITHRTTIVELANQLFPYLTLVEGLKLCAQTFHKDVSQLSCCAG